MTEALAQAKYSCPACGGEAHWNPARKGLVCAFCGTVSPAQETLSAAGQPVVQEYDLAAALRSIPDDQRGWQARKTSVRCQSCQAISVFDATRVGQRCDFCGSSALVPYEEVKEALRPESLLPFKVSETQVRDVLKRWVASRWFAPNRLKGSAVTDTVKGLYIPYWTFDAQVNASWTAESGYYYYETETYRDAEGKTQTRQVRKVRWQWTSGAVSHFFDDELVCASRGVERRLVTGIEPFPTKELVAYNPGYLAGWVVERYQIDLLSAAQAARERMDGATRSLCAQQVPGDTHRNLSVKAAYSRQTFKHILAPIWLLTYRYGAKGFQVAVNGYTGAIAGDYPKSWVKILFAVLVLLTVAAVLGLLVSR
jgi:hypothetical protein